MKQLFSPFVRSTLLGTIALVAFTCFGWCLAHNKFSSNTWTLPTSYLEGEYADFIGTAAFYKALSDGEITHFGEKSVESLGAPDEANWNQYPTPDEALAFLCQTLVGLFGLFPGYNMSVLVGHIAASVTFFLVARIGFRVHALWAFIGGLAFGLAPYQFAQQPHHLACQYIWYLPFFPLVWTWLASDEDLSLGSRRWWQALAVGFITGLQNPFYSNIFCQLVLIIGGVRSWQMKSLERVKSASLIVAAVAFAFFASNLDTLSFRITNTAEMAGTPIIGQREYRWMDIYGFKLVDLFIPPVTHHSSSLATFGRQHRQASALNDEEGSGYLGILGIGCFLFLIFNATRAILDGRLKDVPVEVWWLLWIVLMFNTGGLNSMLAAFTGFTLFRTAIRYSIVVLVISLLYTARWMTHWQEKSLSSFQEEMLRIVTLTVTSGSLLLVLWDQIPKAPKKERITMISNAVQSDKKFVDAIEAALPKKSENKKPMIFQLPVMEGLPLQGVPASHHLRPFLYSSDLHFSYGATGETLRLQKDLERELFQGAEIEPIRDIIQLSPQNVSDVVEGLRRIGFSAIFINCNAYIDRGKGLRNVLQSLGYNTAVESSAKDFLCIML